MPHLRAVLFDLGDTVIQYGPVDRDMLFERAVKRTYRLWSQKYSRMPGYRRYYLHQWFAMRWGYLKQLILRREMNAERYIRRAARKLWLHGSGSFFKQLVRAWYSPLQDVATIETGTHDTLDALRRAGYQLGLISNTFVPGYVLDAHLQRLGLLDYFPKRIYSCDVGYRKPNRRIFELALQAVGSHPAQTVFVGDDLNADIFGAKRAGLLPIWKRPAHARSLHVTQDDVPMIDKLSQLPDVIQRLEAWAARPHRIA